MYVCMYIHTYMRHKNNPTYCNDSLYTCMYIYIFAYIAHNVRFQCKNSVLIKQFRIVNVYFEWPQALNYLALCLLVYIVFQSLCTCRLLSVVYIFCAFPRYSLVQLALTSVRLFSSLCSAICFWKTIPSNIWARQFCTFLPPSVLKKGRVCACVLFEWGLIVSYI